MKKDIHPTFHKDATITCACGEKYETGSTQEKIAVELCANCHPFYTGKQKIVDTARRVERFEAMMKKHEEKAGTKKADKKEKKETQKEAVEEQDKEQKMKEQLEKVKQQINTDEKDEQ